MALTVTAAEAQSQASALASDIGAGATIEIRSGSKPATPETAASGTLLATVAISGSFTASSGTLSAADPASVTIAATGTAGYFRLKTSGGTAIFDGTVGTSGADMIVNSTSFVAGGTFDLGAPSFTVPVA